MRNDPTFWILARASGLVAYALLTSSVLAGLVLKARPFGTSLRPASVTDLHRFLALLGLGALSLHALALLLDRTVPISVADLLVPGIAPYRPLWTGLGVLAAELMVLVYASFSLRSRIGARNWRRLHWPRTSSSPWPPCTGSPPAPTAAPPGRSPSTARRPAACSPQPRGACSSHPREEHDACRIEIGRSPCSQASGATWPYASAAQPRFVLASSYWAGVSHTAR